MDAPAAVPLRFRGIGGVDLAADGWGDPAAPAVVLLHGGGQTRHAWAGTAEALAAAGRHVVNLDLRGHGDSTWAADGDYSYDAYVGDLLAVVADLGRPAALVGASLGGITSLLAVGERGLGADALVLVDITPRMNPEGVDRILGFMRAHPEGFTSLDEAADAVAAYLPHRPRPPDPSGLAKNLRRGEDGRWRWHWDPAFVLGDRRPDGSRHPGRLDDAARAVDVPTLLVRGKLSELVDEASVEHFRELVPHAGYVDVGGAGHMVAGDRNDAFTDAVLRFLAAG